MSDDPTDRPTGRMLPGRVVAVTLVLALSGVLPVRADATDAGAWQYEITPYLWATAMKGDVAAVGVLPKIQVNSSFSDILEHLDMGFMGAFEARKGRWGFLFDAIYMNVSGAATAVRTSPLDMAVLASANADVRVKQTMVGVGGAYRISEGSTAVDAVGGARYSRVSGEARIDAAFFGLAGTVMRKVDEDWVDPYIGGRVQHPLSDRWTIVGYADVGGFGMGSEFTWQAAAGLNYAFSRTVTGKFGYRAIGVDYDRNGFLYDMVNTGAYAGVGIRF